MSRRLWAIDDSGSITRFFHGTINGGGQQIEFTTMNGTIHIRKKAR